MKKGILDIAERQIKTGGYAHLNFGAIAYELDTTRANLHYHFKNKESLALAVTQRYIRDYRSMLKFLSREYVGDFRRLVYAVEDIIWRNIVTAECEGSSV